MENSKAASKWLIVLLIFLVAVAIGVFYYSYSKRTGGTLVKSSPTPTITGVARDKVTVAILGDSTGIYPDGQDEMVTFETNRSMFDPLVDLDKNIMIKKALADSWTSDPNTNTWTFKLHKGVTFHDGTPFTADDVKFTIDQAIANQWWTIDYLGAVDSVTVVDPLTVTIKTKTPDPILVNQLANVLILSKNYKKGDKPNGTGPYKFSEHVKDDHLTLTANASYFQGAPKVAQAVYKVIADEKTAIDALKAKQVDVVQYGIEKDYTSELGSVAGISLQSVTSLYSSNLFVNSVKANSPLANLKVRQAITHALDMKTLVKKLSEPADIQTQIVSNLIFGYNDSLKAAEYNPTLSKSLLSESGVAMPVSITYTDVKGIADDFGNEVAAELNAVGFKVKVDLVDKDGWMKKFKNQEFELVRQSWAESTGDAGATLGAIFHTPDEAGIYGAYNFGYSNKTLDSLIETIDKTFDLNDRKAKLQEALKDATDDVAYVPLYSLKDRWATDAKLLWTSRPDSAVLPYEMAGKQ